MKNGSIFHQNPETYLASAAWIFEFRNAIDPMQMIAQWHDNYPKQDLDKMYLGDGLPPCSELPKAVGLSPCFHCKMNGITLDNTDNRPFEHVQVSSRPPGQGSFLLTGARYEFLSSYSGSDVLKLQSSSPLYQALCGSAGAARPQRDDGFCMFLLSGKTRRNHLTQPEANVEAM